MNKCYNESVAYRYSTGNRDLRTMKIAVASDIHGNVLALEAVLADLERQGGADHIVVTGDMVSYGPTPNEVFAILRKLPHAHFLQGNTDRYLVEKNYPSTGGDEWKDKLLLSFRWTAEHMGAEVLHFLETLPLSLTVREGNWRLLAVHASPRSDEEGITATTSDDDFDRMGIDPALVDLLVCGHTHVPLDRTVKGVRVVNVGSVGLPFDGIPRACYALISVTPGAVTSPEVVLRRVTYDVEKVVEQFYAANHPAADISAYNLRTARSVGTSLIYPPEMRHGRSGRSSGGKPGDTGRQLKSHAHATVRLSL
jgi:predicted phosphodiesterase